MLFDFHVYPLSSFRSYKTRTMLRLTVLSILVCLALCKRDGIRIGNANATMINYGNCYWLYGGEGAAFTCDQGYVATGACGSETMKKCNSRSAGLRCCEIDGTWSKLFYDLRP